MVNRRMLSFFVSGALGASLSAASACSTANPPGFQSGDDAGTGVTNASSSENETNNNGETNGGNGTNTGETNSGDTNTETNTGGTSTGGTSTGGTTSGSSSTQGSASTSTGGSVGQAFCGTSGMYAMPCSAPSTGTPIALADCIPETLTGNGDGYVSAFGDGTSAACVDTSFLCGMGTSAVKSAANYGSGFAITLGGVATNATGLTYAVTSIPSNGLQISVTDAAGKQYAAPTILTATSGTILWGSFTELGIPDGGPPFSSSDTIQTITFQANTGATSATWSFCVTALSGFVTSG